MSAPAVAITGIRYTRKTVFFLLSDNRYVCVPTKSYTRKDLYYLLDYQLVDDGSLYWPGLNRIITAAELLGRGYVVRTGVPAAPRFARLRSALKCLTWGLLLGCVISFIIVLLNLDGGGFSLLTVLVLTLIIVYAASWYFREPVSTNSAEAKKVAKAGLIFALCSYIIGAR